LVFAIAILLSACLAGEEARALDLSRSVGQLRHTTWIQRDGMPAQIGAIAQTPDGYLWIGSASGLYRFDGIHVEPFTQDLPGGAIMTLAVSPSGDLWIGSTEGVSRLSQGRLTTFDIPGLAVASTGIRFIGFGSGGDVWVANDKVAHFDGRRWQVVQSDWGTSELYRKPGGVWGMAVARDGVVWTKNLLGLYYLRPGTSRFEKAEGYGGSLFDFARAPDGLLWTADAASLRFYALPDLGPSGPVPPPARVGAPVPVGVVGHVVFDHDGALWCANRVTGGFYRLRGVTSASAQVEALGSADGLALGYPGEIFDDREGDIWLSSDTGLERLSPANVVTERAISVRSQGSDIAASQDAVYVADGGPPPAPAVGHPSAT
jgi:ligand-binding sensor domain-containing protein